MESVLPLRKFFLRSFAVWIIPYTKRHTNLDRATIGDLVNLEFDILAKYRRENGCAVGDERMMARRSTKRRPRVVGVIASRADLERALRMRRPPDLFELRLDRLAGMADQLENVLPKLHTPLIITARHPHEGGSSKFQLRQRRDLLARFLNSRRLYRCRITFSPCAASLARNRPKRKTSGESFRSTISSPHRVRESWRPKRARPNRKAQIFSKLLRALTRRWNSDVCLSS